MRFAALFAVAAGVASAISASAQAQEYHPASLVSCQAKVHSTADNADCYQREIDKLSARLPTGLASWKAGAQKSCNAKYEQDGTAGEGESMDCILQAVAAKIGLRR